MGEFFKGQDSTVMEGKVAKVSVGKQVRGSSGCVRGWHQVACVLVEATIGLTQVTALLRSLDLRAKKNFLSFTSSIYHGHNILCNRATFWNLPF